MDARKQAACHQSLVVYIGERLHEGLAARRALVPLMFDVDHDTLGVDGQIKKGLFKRAEADQPIYRAAVPIPNLK